MDKTKPINPIAYQPGLKKIRKRRWFLWAVICAYLPAMMIALDSPDYRNRATVVFCVWIALLIIAVVFACIVRCPRCGECFHTHGPTFLPLRRCLHCALHINADKRGAEAISPQAKPPKKK
ncbi:hypothetical protein SAMN05660420_00947 [Desulfuromusa kysingii]|uniref:Uncharacterized protein n=1 Tax=Desulfuromusa kysingii TaxID=37625 RepID=A0A1H3XFI2_9BACT|nr:hypothetical protein [Desulfuromusa kysingii]SDZ97980.1 hypothetical protein SAMN05660420_00947 [Desulfuromusa kysingii]